MTAFFMLSYLAIAIWPATGNKVLGKANEKPEFSMFTRLSIMFGAGISIGMLTYSIAKPIIHFAYNPYTTMENTTGITENNVRNAYQWALINYAHTLCACCGIVRKFMGYLSYARALPRSIRLGLELFFGSAMSGWAGHIADIAAILATLIGLGVTIACGVYEFASGIFIITGIAWMIDESGGSSLRAQLFGLIIIIGTSCVFAISGLVRSK